MRQEIIKIAQKEIGYKEEGNNQTKYGAWYGMQDEWCAIFVSWCANQVGALGNIIPKMAYVPYSIKWFKDKGQFKDKNYIPQSGDIIFIDYENNNLPDHMGIVENVSGDTIYTIEGNKNHMVQRGKYVKTDKTILGYGIPKYTDDPISSTGVIKTFKKAAIIYENSNLTGTKYDYKANTTVEILEHISTIDKVKSRATGRVGYVYNVDLYKEDEIKTSMQKIKTIKVDTTLILREKPTISSKAIADFINNTTVIVLEENVANTDGYNWDKVQIRTMPKYIGYMANKYLK